MRGRVLHRRWGWWVAAFLIVVAVVALPWRTPDRDPQTNTATSVTAAGDGAEQQPGPNARDGSTPRERPALLLVDETQKSPPGSGTLRARPVDPATLADLPGYEPVNFGHHYNQAVSPDGRTLAVIAWPSGSPLDTRGGVLHLIDLATWRTVTHDLSLKEWITGPLFAADGDSLYWLEYSRRDPAHGIPRTYRLMRYTLTNRTLTALSELPESFVPWQMRQLRSGERVAVYGLPTSTGNLAEDAPHVLILDLASGQIVADVRLEGVRAGQFRVDAANVDRPPFEMFRPGLGWDIPRDRLYIAHAESNRLSVVDLATGALIHQNDIRPKRSWLDRLLGRFAGMASAKMVPTSDRQVVVSPDGSRIYVTGTRLEMHKDANGHWRERTIPLGLQVIDTERRTEIQRAELPLSGIALSVDARWLLGHMLPDETAAGGSVSADRHRAALFDAETLQELRSFELTGVYPYAETAHNGRYLYLPSVRDDGARQPRSYRVMDTETFRIIAEREAEGFADLIELAPNAPGN